MFAPAKRKGLPCRNSCVPERITKGLLLFKEGEDGEEGDAQVASGRGVATEGLRGLCYVAREVWGLRTLRAAVSLGNVASQHVLEKADFVAVGPASDRKST